MAQQAEHVSFGAADEVREFPHGRAEIVKIRGGEIGRLVLEPGWRWSNDVKPSGHDAWVLGDEAVVVVDWFGAGSYAKEPAAFESVHLTRSGEMSPATRSEQKGRPMTHERA